MTQHNWINAGLLEDLKEEGHKLIKGGIVVFYHQDKVYALDNRCPHLGFPLHMGSLCDGILTCHWHHARFDVCGGGTFDPWADDVPIYPIKVESGEVWVQTEGKGSGQAEVYMERLKNGLEQNIGLVIAKAVVGLIELGVPDSDIVRTGIEYGTKQRRSGWGSGLTILTAMANVLPKLDKQGRILALYHGLVRVARDSSGSGTRFLLGALPHSEISLERLMEWYRDCMEVRDTQGAERILLTAVQNGAKTGRLSDMMLAAVTDHFFIDGGHTLDFHNKAFESLRYVDQEQAKQVLASLVPLLGDPVRSEELHSWQAPLDLVSPLKQAFEQLRALTSAKGEPKKLDRRQEEKLLNQLLSDNPLETIEALTEAFQSGAEPVRMARIVTLAAARRITRFHTQNEFGDWISVLHTFTYCHAVHECLIRSEHPPLLRAVYDGAMKIYLDRFLNIPPASLPDPVKDPFFGFNGAHNQLLELLDKQQQVTPAARWVAEYLHRDGNPQTLIQTLGIALLREDADFHSFQMFEAAVAQYDYWNEETDEFASQAKETLLLALTRYLAAHAPTSREMPHTAQIAWRLHRGEKLFEEEK